MEIMKIYFENKRNAGNESLTEDIEEKIATVKDAVYRKVKSVIQSNGTFQNERNKKFKVVIDKEYFDPEPFEPWMSVYVDGDFNKEQIEVLERALNKTLSKFDKDAYFDVERYGKLIAILSF